MSFYAQTALKGIVMDDTNYPIPGATIIIKGTSIGVTSDFDGNFSIDIPSANSTIVISYLGYESEEVIITNQDTIMTHPNLLKLQQMLVCFFDRHFLGG